MRKSMKCIGVLISLLLLAGCGSNGKSSAQLNNTQPSATETAEPSETTVSSTTVTTETTTTITTVITQPEETESETEPTEEEAQEADTDIFSSLPKSFYFSSGAGAWATEFELNSDGTFTGIYHDSDMGSTGSDYPNGTVYICMFEGKFTDLKQIDEYTYSMRLDYLNCEGTPGEEYYKNNKRYIYSEAHGLEDADELMIYLPGAPFSDMPEEFLSWAFIFDRDEYTAIPGDRCGIYNVTGQKGFIGYYD